MHIGILSDTHGKTKRLKKVLEILARRQVDIVVHCGDIINPDDVTLLGAFAGQAYLVAGNMDRQNLPDLARAARTAGVKFAEEFVNVPLKNKQKLAATHGHYEMLLDELIRGGQYAYVCHGHTHRSRDERYESTRILNPGALYHPKGTDRKTFVLLDTKTDTVEVLDV